MLGVIYIALKPSERCRKGQGGKRAEDVEKREGTWGPCRDQRRGGHHPGLGLTQSAHLGWGGLTRGGEERVPNGTAGSGGGEKENDGGILGGRGGSGLLRGLGSMSPGWETAFKTFAVLARGEDLWGHIRKAPLFGQ